jgi:hypothetical protein
MLIGGCSPLKRRGNGAIVKKRRRLERRSPVGRRWPFGRAMNAIAIVAANQRKLMRWVGRKGLDVGTWEGLWVGGKGLDVCMWEGL